MQVMKFTVLFLLLTLITIPVSAQPSLDVSIQGISDEHSDTILRDREEAVVDAKLKALIRIGVQVGEAKQMTDFEEKQTWVNSKLKGYLLPGYKIMNIGYGDDGLYHIVFNAKLTLAGKSITEGDIKYQTAMTIIETDKGTAMKILKEVVDDFPFCESADDAHYQRILNSDFWAGTDRLRKMKMMYPDSPLIYEAQRFLDNFTIEEPVTGIKFVAIPLEDFMMGSPETEKGRNKSEGPLHNVIIRKVYMSQTEITQKQWMKVMEKNPSKFQGDNRPVERVSWDEAHVFLDKLNDMDPGKNYRLPTEAEWEYACKGGVNTMFSFGDKEIELTKYAWFADNSEKKTHPVGTRMRNPYGLFDMHGNVMEWVEDPYHPNYKFAPTDGGVWQSLKGNKRIVRGGSYKSDVLECRSAARHWNYKDSEYSDAGFRIVRNP